MSVNSKGFKTSESKIGLTEPNFNTATPWDYYRVTLQQVMDLEMIQLFQTTQNNENGTTGNIMKQAVGSQGTSQ